MTSILRRPRHTGRLGALAALVGFSALVTACGGGGSDGTTNPPPSPPSSTYTASGGVAQKGPLILGSTVTAQELNASLSPTGRQYSYQTTSDLGTFNPTTAFGSQYIGVNASGYYFDEITNAVSSGPVTLNSYTDLSATSVLNVNLLTTLAYQRTQNLVSQSNLSFAAAQSQAQREVLAALGIRDNGQLGNFNTWDLSQGRDGDDILAAVSSIFVYGNTSGNLGALIASFQSDISTDGVISNLATKATLLASSQAVDPTVVATHLSQKYASSGVSFAAADIRNWIDPDGDGVVGKFEFQVPNATQSSSFTLPSSATDPHAGATVTVSAGQLSVNGTPVSGPIQIASGNVLTIAPPAGTFPDGALTAYLSSGAIRLAKVTFVKGLASIAVTPASSSLPVGSVQQFVATGTFTDGSTADVTASATWSSSQPSSATINSTTGVAQGIAVGTTTIGATSGAISGSTALNILPAALQSIVVTPNTLATGVGIARQLRASGSYSDGSTADLTPTATWTTSSPSIATVTGGLVTGIAVGSTSATATVGSVSGNAAVNVSTNTWSPAGSISGRRAQHTATLLPNGKVVVTGGRGHSSANLLTAELYDPVANTWSAAGTPVRGRREHTSTLLADGRVLVAGGMTALTSWALSAEIYDPSTNTWSATADMPGRASRHTATLLPDGRVLVAGGTYGAALSSVWIYDPASDTWTTGPSMSAARSGATATLLPNGRVLVAGGFSASAEIYDPVAEMWTPAASMTSTHTGHQANLLPNGRVFVTDSNGSAEIYDPVADSWSAAASPAARLQHTATLLANGRVLVAGDLSGFPSATSEIYDPATNTWGLAATLAHGHSAHTATLLQNGSVMVVGGTVVAEGAPAPTELYW